MTHRHFTVLPFLLAMFVAVAGMPQNVYQVCRGEMGHEHGQPWRSTVDGLIRRGRTLMARLRAMFTGWCGHPLALPAAAMAVFLVAALVLPADAHAQLANVGVLSAASQLKPLRAQQEKIRARLNELSAKTATDEGLTDAERAEMAALRVKGTDIASALVDAEAANERERLEPDPETQNPDAAASERARAEAGIRIGKDRAQDDPKRGFKDHKDYLAAVMNAGLGRKMDARLMPLRAAAGSDEQGEYNDPVGGFFMPSAIAPGVLSIAPESDPILPLCTPVEMTAPTVSFNARVDKNHATSVSGGFRVYRREETVDGTSSRAKFEQVVLTANEEFGVAFASERLLSDSPMSFVAIIQAGFRDEYVANGMNERINGTGTGERQGALETPCKIEVSKETGQGADTILKENIDQMGSRCWRYSRAVWLANHNTRPQLKSIVQVVGTGGSAVPYFVTEGTPAGFDGMLDGRPLLFTEFAKPLGDAGDLILMVPTEYLEGTYQTEQYAESIHVRFVAAERAFRFYRRNDGQWWWRSALTPRNGSTLSPVVTLAARA